jgi:hypothetical protein
MGRDVPRHRRGALVGAPLKCILAQDWLTVRGLSGTVVTQPESTWVDLAGYRDVVVWLDVKERTPSASGPTIAYQSAVAKDETLFTTIATFTPGMGVTTTVVIPEVTTPFSRWMRWQLSLVGSAWDLQFRLWLAVNGSGRSLAHPSTHLSR